MNKRILFLWCAVLVYASAICCSEKHGNTKNQAFFLSFSSLEKCFKPALPSISTETASAVYKGTPSAGWALGFPDFLKGYVNSLYNAAWLRLKPVWPSRFDEVARNNIAVVREIFHDMKQEHEKETKKDKAAIDTIAEELKKAQEDQKEHHEEGKKEVAQANDRISALKNLAIDNKRKIEEANGKNQKNREEYKKQVFSFALRFDNIRFLVQPNANSGMQQMVSGFAKTKKEQDSEVPFTGSTYSQTELD